ncbi:glycosyltransferase [Seohaeicola nanhaiensis]|uniref:Glycosyltransferase n=1 Tax=Seohaeicola nanhaiensis TaxID=1387282 RepID=A0ABV9KLK5_9RHOB
MHDAGVPSTFTRTSRRLGRALKRSVGGAALAALRARLGGRHPRRVLLFSDGLAYTSEQQFAPLLRHRQQIAARFGLVFVLAGTAAIRDLKAADLKGCHAVGLKLSFRTPAAEAVALARRLFAVAQEAGARTLYFDGDDDQGVQWPAVLDMADAYIKKHRLSDPAAYRRGFIGKSNLTDHVARTFGVAFDSDDTPATAPLDDGQATRILLGWNIAQDDKIYDLCTDIGAALPDGPRDIDILCRASVPPTHWTFGLRDPAVQTIKSLNGSWALHAPTDRVSQAEYYREMLRARLTVSPFGFGELCWRDFEAILCGSLLVKPDMSHVETWPDLFVPHETYVPLAWDFSDLGKACAPYLDDEARRAQVASTARERLLHALSGTAFLDRLETVLGKAGLL